MRLNDKQILVIDDDEVTLTLLMRVLEDVGCKVNSSPSIKVALEVLKKSVPDLILLDLNMPELDGFTFLKFRYINKMLASIPVIILSGTKDEDRIQKALEMGANQFIEKPFEARILLQKLRFIFYSQDNFTYQFPEGQLPVVDAEIAGAIVEQCIGRIKVESQVRFCRGKSVQVNAEDYIRHQGEETVCKVDNQTVELREGFFRTVLTPTGQDGEGRKRFEVWVKNLGK